ncbi:MAG: accessory factor UbiK family protein [Gammaproteobacteria bacterium]|nr:accessory factor UbiK family protein [Gammaproteobacteria bacterium]
MPNDTIDQLARRLAESVPDGIRTLGEDLEKNFRAVLRASLSKLDLVTREEFEVQEAVLQRSREMLEQMETRLAELEAGLAEQAKSRRKKTAKKKQSKKKKE